MGRGRALAHHAPGIGLHSKYICIHVCIHMHMYVYMYVVLIYNMSYQTIFIAALGNLCFGHIRM